MINKLRLITTAFLSNGDSVLLLHRAKTKTIAPGMWSGVGGHLEPNELGNIRSSCLREIHGETGLTEADIRDLSLCYVILRQGASELRQQFVFFGTTDIRNTTETDEGTLHWIPWSEVLDRKMSEAIAYTRRHCLSIKPYHEGVWVGTMGANDSGAAIKWSLSQDWEQ